MSIKTRKDFMTFFRDKELLSQLTPDDRIEIFSCILTDEYNNLTKKLLDKMLSNYGVNNLLIIDFNKQEQTKKLLFKN